MPKPKKNPTTKIPKTFSEPKFPYTSRPGGLRKFLTLVPQKPKPMKVNFDLIKAWGLKDKNNYTIVRVLKAPKLVSEPGQRTEHTEPYMSISTSIFQRIKLEEITSTCLRTSRITSTEGRRRSMDDDLAKVISFHSGVAAVGSKYGRARRNLVSANSITAMEIAPALEEFMESVRYLNTRRTGGAILRLQSEADVQDAIYLMLRPWVTDLVPEDPSGRVGNRYTIKDFLSPSAKTVIEAKFIRDRDHGRHISSELH